MIFWFFGSEACGILAPSPGIKPMSSVLQDGSLTAGPAGKFLGALQMLRGIFD